MKCKNVASSGVQSIALSINCSGEVQSRSPLCGWGKLLPIKRKDGLEQEHQIHFAHIVFHLENFVFMVRFWHRVCILGLKWIVQSDAFRLWGSLHVGLGLQKKKLCLGWFLIKQEEGGAHLGSEEISWGFAQRLTFTSFVTKCLNFDILESALVLPHLFFWSTGQWNVGSSLGAIHRDS